METIIALGRGHGRELVGSRRRKAGLLLLLLLVAAALARRASGPLHFRFDQPIGAPSDGTSWPWPHAEPETLHPGVTHWLTTTSDGTTVDLLEFDFAANPALRLELYDQDEDDAVPFDNQVMFYANAVGQVTRHLNELGRGPVLAAWNGLYFAVDDYTPDGLAHHIAPIVLNGEVYHLVGNHRWTFGVQYADGRPRFKTLLLPDKATLAHEFTYAAAGAQCLIKDGQPLAMPAYPARGERIPAKSPRPTEGEAGYIPQLEFLRTSRTSMGWSADSQQLYLMEVKEPDREGVSIGAFMLRIPLMGGWTVADRQAFWVSFGVVGAVSVDGGDVMEMVYRRGDGRYVMLPPRLGSRAMRLEFDGWFEGAPEGGTMMYFYVREG